MIINRKKLRWILISFYFLIPADPRRVQDADPDPDSKIRFPASFKITAGPATS